jgi:hypothetical protein
MGLQKDNIIDCKNCHREALAVATQHCFPGLLHCVRNDGEESLLHCVRNDGEESSLHCVPRHDDSYSVIARR